MLFQPCGNKRWVYCWGTQVCGEVQRGVAAANTESSCKKTELHWNRSSAMHNWGHSQNVQQWVLAVGLRCANSVCLEGQNAAWPFHTQVGRLPGRMACAWAFTTYLEPLPEAKHCSWQMGKLSLLYPHPKCVPNPGVRVLNRPCLIKMATKVTWNASIQSDASSLWQWIS